MRPTETAYVILARAEAEAVQGPDYYSRIVLDRHDVIDVTPCAQGDCEYRMGPMVFQRRRHVILCLESWLRRDAAEAVYEAMAMLAGVQP